MSRGKAFAVTALTALMMGLIIAGLVLLEFMMAFKIIIAAFAAHGFIKAVFSFNKWLRKNDLDPVEVEDEVWEGIR